MSVLDYKFSGDASVNCISISQDLGEAMRTNLIVVAVLAVLAVGCDSAVDQSTSVVDEPTLETEAFFKIESSDAVGQAVPPGEGVQSYVEGRAKDCSRSVPYTEDTNADCTGEYIPNPWHVQTPHVKQVGSWGTIGMYWYECYENAEDVHSDEGFVTYMVDYLASVGWSTSFDGKVVPNEDMFRTETIDNYGPFSDFVIHRCIVSGYFPTANYAKRIDFGFNVNPHPPGTYEVATTAFGRTRARDIIWTNSNGI